MKEMNWKSILANEPYKYRSLSAAISKMVMRLLRHNDQDERHIDGAVSLEYYESQIFESIRISGARHFFRKR